MPFGAMEIRHGHCSMLQFKNQVHLYHAACWRIIVYY